MIIWRNGMFEGTWIKKNILKSDSYAFCCEEEIILRRHEWLEFCRPVNPLLAAYRKWRTILFYRLDIR